MTELQRQIDHYKAVRARLAANAIQTAKSPANQNKRVRVIMRLPSPEPVEPINTENMTRRQFLKYRSEHYGFTVDQILGQSRKKYVSHFRQLIMLEMKEAFPRASLPEIGITFGGRDHTTILHGIAVATKRREDGTPPPPAEKPKRQRILADRPDEKRKRLTIEQEDQLIEIWKRGDRTNTMIAQMFGLHYKTPGKIIKRRGATR